ncbi:MAG TPA: hypothetical protein VL966_13290 [Alphaproteobacteria bacterium]|jgi:hypothetical protein|nr:hypothetical protein [Alphaproteobacteria bacterium]
MNNDTNQDADSFEIRAGQQFPGSRPGKGTALVVVVAIAAVVLYSFWPSIASALHVS